MAATPGWYDDERAHGQQRWWTGRDWSAHVRAKQSPPRQSPSPLQIATVGLGAGAAAVIVGSFMPWIKATVPLVGSMSRSGMDGGDGILTAIGGLALGGVAVALWLRRLPARGAAWATGVLAALIGLVAAVDFVDIGHRFAQAHAESGLVATTLGPGLFVIMFGVIVAGAAVCVLLASNRSQWVS